MFENMGKLRTDTQGCSLNYIYMPWHVCALHEYVHIYNSIHTYYAHTYTQRQKYRIKQVNCNHFNTLADFYIKIF